MGLSAEQQKMLEELTKLASEPDQDDFEVEIFSGDKGARIPASKAAAWLYKEFGIGDAPTPPAAPEGEQDANPAKAVRRLFGTPPAAKGA